MAAGDQYRIKAAQFQAQANHETRPLLKRSMQALAQVYLRLAGQAEKNADTDISYGPILPPRGDGTDPDAR